MQRGFTYLTEKQFRLAINDFNEAEKLGFVEIGLYYNRAFCEFSINLYRDALRDYNIYLSFKPEDKSCRTYRALTYKNLGSYEAAIEDFDWMISHGTTPGFAHGQIGEIYEFTGRSMDALCEYLEAKKAGYNDPVLSLKIKMLQDRLKLRAE